jgi:thiol-disulfide isomerase/thioredoxin
MKGSLRHVVAGGLVLLLAVGISAYVKHQVANDKRLVYEAGDRLQPFAQPTLAGRTVRLDSVLRENRVVWINFWATWCGPCRREMPMLADLHRAHHDSGFAVVAVNVREDRATVASFLEKHPQPFPVLLDTTGTLANRFRIDRLPTSFLVDDEGTVIAADAGVQEWWFTTHIEERLPKAE